MSTVRNESVAPQTVIGPDVFVTDKRPTVVQRLMARMDMLWMFATLIAIILVFGIVNHHMFSEAAWQATADYAVEYAVLAIGSTFVMVAGEIDISSGAILGFSGICGALAMSKLLGHVPSLEAAVLGVLVMLVSGAALGFLNGFLRVWLRVPSFIVTLGTMLAIGFGAVNLVSGGLEVANLPSQIDAIGSISFLGGWLPLPVLVALVLGLLFGLFLQRSRFGLHTYMIGSNRIAAQRAGIKVNRQIVACFVVSGLLGGVAGLLVTANLTLASPLSGQNDELYAITAVVIGGASLYGGRGGVFGTFVGVAILAVLTTGLVIVNVSAFWQDIAIGAVLIAAVGIDQLRARVRE